MKPTPCVIFRVAVTETPLSLMSQSANAPANAPQTAMASQGSAENCADRARSRPSACLKYRGIHASRMKYPQLFTKLANTHANTGGATREGATRRNAFLLFG